MELLKLDERPAEFKWEDITIFYRKTVTVEDKFTIDTAGATVKNDKIEFGVWDFYKTMIRVFVVGWQGVTQDGNKISYSYDAMMKLPSTVANDLIMSLGFKIAQDTGFITEKKEAGDLKNG
jgi:hypothetical protein